MSNVSKHSYNNELFQNLINVVQGEMTKTAQTEENGPISGMGIFSSTTQEDFNAIKEDELKLIKAELDWAANQSKVSYSTEDLIKFASNVQKDKLKGKNLERAARNFCLDLSRDQAGPQGTFRHSVQRDDFINEFTKSTIIPAGYSKQASGPNDSATGRPLGSEHNPNTIFNPNAIAEKAQIPMGDEQIKASRKQIQEKHAEIKKEYWNELSNKLADNNLGKGIIKAGNYDEGSPVIDQKLPANSMSIFSNDRDFSNIPETDNAQILKSAAEERANKKTASKNEWNVSEPNKSTRLSTEKLFNEWIKE